jgi:hypothetical protein
MVLSQFDMEHIAKIIWETHNELHDEFKDRSMIQIIVNPTGGNRPKLGEKVAQTGVVTRSILIGTGENQVEQIIVNGIPEQIMELRKIVLGCPITVNG